MIQSFTESQMKRKRWWKYALGLFLVGYVIVKLCALPTKAEREMADALQEKINAMRVMQPGNVPGHFLDGEAAPQEDDFDPNEYFTVFTHISMESGYVLDYVYRGDHLGGNPVLYARPETQAPYETYWEFLNAMEVEPQPTYKAQSGAFEYLNHVIVDDTPEGFLEIVALTYMGDQFYLQWHAGYNDERIVANQAAAIAVLDAADRFLYGHVEVPNRVRIAAQYLNFTPDVRIGKSEVDVRFLTFTKWGGFISYNVSIQRDFPHVMLDWKVKTLVRYDCEVCF